MKRESKQHQKNEVLDLLARYPDGVSISQILDYSEDRWPRRSLQRWLAELVNENKINHTGKMRSVRYLPINQDNTKQIDLEIKNISSSADGKRVYEFVTQSICERSPASYNVEFLNSYIPNQTRYIYDHNLIKLYQLGIQDNDATISSQVAHELFNRLYIDLAYNSTRLEERNYSLLDTVLLVEASLVGNVQASFEAQIILNHKQAISFIFDNLNEVQLNVETLISIHALLTNNLLGNTKQCGTLRELPSWITGSTFKPLEIPHMILEQLELLLSKASLIEEPFEQAFFLMVHLPYLQPFVDTNKRLSRLISNIPLLKNHLCPISFVDVPTKLYQLAILGVLELRDWSLLLDIFMYGYMRSATQYSNMTRNLTTGPDLLKMKYRIEIKDILTHVVTHQMNKKKTIQYVHQWANKHIEKNELERFIYIIESELLALHPGNLVIYRLPQDKFQNWQKAFYNK